MIGFRMLNIQGKMLLLESMIKVFIMGMLLLMSLLKMELSREYIKKGRSILGNMVRMLPGLLAGMVGTRKEKVPMWKTSSIGE